MVETISVLKEIVLLLVAAAGGGGLTFYFSIKYIKAKEQEELVKLRVENEERRIKYEENMEALVLTYKEKLHLLSKEMLELNDKLNEMGKQLHAMVKEKVQIEEELDIIKEKCKQFITF